MIIDCLSDPHGFYPELEGGDLLIIAGDCTANDTIPSWHKFFNWIDKQNYKRKIMIAGNHDNFCIQWATSDDSIYEALVERPTVTYLCDSGTEFEGLKIWGSPWTTKFEGINPHCCAFTVDTDEELDEKWKLIPEDADILITHSPPFGILDQIKPSLYENPFLRNKGSQSLRNFVLDKIKPKIHVFGHIHENGGKLKDKNIPKFSIEKTTTKFINASYVNENYKPKNKPIRVIL